MSSSCPGSDLRANLCKVLRAGGLEKSVVARVADDDDLVRHRFFWSSAGMMLFGRAEELTNPAELYQV